MDAGKEQAAMANHWSQETVCDIPTNMAVVNQYIKRNQTPSCPDGGTYRYGRLDEAPSCSLFNPKDKKTFGHSMK